MLGVISSTRDCWASRRVGSGRSSKCYIVVSHYFTRFSGIVRLERTLVVWRTLQSRGKSLTPASSVEMEESRS